MDVRAVVVGVDGTPCSEPAIDWAADEARRRGMPLEILHLRERSRHPHAGSGDAPDEQDEDWRILEAAKERAAAGARLKELKLGHDSSQLAPAVVAGNKMLEQEQRRNEREIYIFTDTQALPWNSFKRDVSSKESQWDPAQINDRTTCFVTLLGSPSPEPRSIAGVSVHE